MKDVSTVLDDLETRCPRLGGPVSFGYCRKVSGGLPCSRCLVCWELIFPVAQYMARALSPEEWKRVFESPTEGRLDQILKAAGQAKKQE